MKLSSIVPLLFVATATLVLFGAGGDAPHVLGRTGEWQDRDVIAIAGENLDKANVGKVYLTDGKNDLECEITGQTATEIKIKIPAKATGRLALMILTGGKEPKLIEQPVKVTIE